MIVAQLSLDVERGLKFFTVCPFCGELLDVFDERADTVGDPAKAWQQATQWAAVAQRAHDRICPSQPTD